MKPFLFLLLLFPSLLQAQFSEHFDADDLKSDTLWTGTYGRFQINRDHQLQLNDQKADTAWLFTAGGMLPAVEWHFWVKAAFSPSSKNFIRIYLAANDSVPGRITEGYFLQLGEKGTADAPELFRQSNDTLVSVCRGTEGSIAAPFALHIKVLCDTLGNWQLWTDASGVLKKEAEGRDQQYPHRGFFGLYCVYTKSNARKMFFDDIYAGPPVVDTVPPEIDSLVVMNDTTVKLLFSEAIDTASVNPACFGFDPPAGNIKRFLFSSGHRVVTLVFDRPLLNRQSYHLSVSGIKDPAGNRLQEQTLSFVFVIPEPFDVVFNEIMADPVPAVGLPAYEYLELFNRTDVEMNLSGWQLVLGKSVKIFGKISLPAHGFLLVCKKEAVPDFSPFGKVYGFSGFSLTNSGERLQLFDKSGKKISETDYRKDWYDDDDKADGGWSLEQVNPENVCAGGDNWKAAVDSRGGTPDAQNSVFDTVLLRPAVNGLQVAGAHSLILGFTQTMDSVALTSPALYAITPGPVQVDTVRVLPGARKIRLQLSEAMDSATVYRLMVSMKIKNCSGLAAGRDTTLRFGLPQPAMHKDVVINEVLFYPLEGGAEYVELYNRSQKVIDLSTLLLGTVKNHPPNPPDSLFYDLTFDQKLFLPGDYMVLTPSPEKVKAQYRTSHPRAFLKINPFPLLNKVKGSVLLFRVLHKIDAFDYSEKMQYPLLNYTQGVALERVNPDGETNDPDNWHSASSSAGFGTPGDKNSQRVALPSDSLQGDVNIIPGIFSPDNDGYQDILHISYRFDTPGNTITIRIFNAAGQLVRHLVNDAYVGTSGVFSWDGLQDDQTKAPVGIYVIYIRVFNEKGLVKQFKKTAVLATKL